MKADSRLPNRRITYRDGQLLASADLDHEREREAYHLALHARYVHRVWGIAFGLNATLLPNAKAVHVSSGYAVDAAGCDLVLSRPLTVPVSPGAGPQTQVLSLRCPEPCGCCGTRHGSDQDCGRPSAIRIPPPEARWEPAEAVMPGATLILATAIVQGQTIVGALDLRARRPLRPLAGGPHVARGATAAARTGWAVWSEPNHPQLGLQVTVDTSEAGFRTTPHYFASLVRDGDVMDEPFAWIHSASSESFVLRISGQAAPWGLTETPEAAEEKGFIASWIGIEPRPPLSQELS
jgi:hypothetical protein